LARISLERDNYFMTNNTVWVVGHRHPDTDSICAAISYAYLKNQIDPTHTYEPKRAGSINPETAYVLDRFGVEAPELVTDVGTQIMDIAFRETAGINSNISIKNAWDLMQKMDVVTLPVVNKKNKLEGLIAAGDIAKSYMDVYDTTVLSKAKTQYRNICETLNGEVMAGNAHSFFMKGKTVVASGSLKRITSILNPEDLVIVSDREDVIPVCMNANVSCIILTNNPMVKQEVIDEANKREIIIIRTPFDTFTVARLINQSMPVRHFMTTKNIIHFHMDDYLDEVREVMSKVRHRDFPVLDEYENYIGMFSRRYLLGAQKKKVILVDHNERSQAVHNIEETEILEIIDHHRIGSLETMAPVYFRNQPLGCTATIIYQMYQEKGVEIPPVIAGLLCSAILSDTLMFRSPTCTVVDKDVAMKLAEIAQIDVEAHAIQMFEAGSDFGNKTEEEILNQDYKTFYSGKIAFGVAQISGMSRPELDKVKERVKPLLVTEMGEKRLDMIFIMLTDILNESTELVCDGEGALLLAESAFGVTANEGGVMLKGVVSRKKQVIPALMNTLAEQ